MLILLGAVAVDAKMAPMFRLGFKETEQVGVDCGDDGVKQWPRIRGGTSTVEITSATTCSECYVIDSEGTGCDGDCEWDDEKAVCFGEKDKGGLEACEIAAIVIGILVFLLLLAIIIYFVLAKNDKGNNNLTQVEREKKKRQDFERERRESLERQAQMERTTPGPAEQQRELVQNPALLPPPRTSSRRNSIPSLYPAADSLEPVTVSNVVVGMEVVRGRSWNFVDQDGGKGSVGTVEGCIKTPNWWWVRWEGTKHAYYCGDDATDRCDLAIKP